MVEGLSGNALNLAEVVGRRVRRDTELAELVKGSFKERTHLEGQTVGSLLATIPAILQKEGLTLTSISDNILSLQSSLPRPARTIRYVSHVATRYVLVLDRSEKMAANERWNNLHNALFG